MNPGGTDALRRTCGADTADACVDKLAAPSAVKPVRRERATPVASPAPPRGR